MLRALFIRIHYTALPIVAGSISSIPNSFKFTMENFRDLLLIRRVYCERISRSVLGKWCSALYVDLNAPEMNSGQTFIYFFPHFDVFGALRLDESERTSIACRATNRRGSGLCWPHGQLLLFELTCSSVCEHLQRTHTIDARERSLRCACRLSECCYLASGQMFFNFSMHFRRSRSMQPAKT